MLKRPYRFRVPGYSLEYVLMDGRYTRAAEDAENIYFWSKQPLRRTVLMRETAFESDPASGGLMIAKRDRSAVGLFVARADGVIRQRYPLPEDFASNYGRLWKFVR